MVLRTFLERSKNHGEFFNLLLPGLAIWFRQSCLTSPAPTKRALKAISKVRQIEKADYDAMHKDRSHVPTASFQKFNLEKRAQPLGDLMVKRAF